MTLIVPWWDCMWDGWASISKGHGTQFLWVVCVAHFNPPPFFTRSLKNLQHFISFVLPTMSNISTFTNSLKILLLLYTNLNQIEPSSFFSFKSGFLLVYEPPRALRSSGAGLLVVPRVGNKNPKRGHIPGPWSSPVEQPVWGCEGFIYCGGF